MKISKIMLLSGLVFLQGCTTVLNIDGLRNRRGTSSSLVDFLYPNGETPPRLTALPTVHLPARVGVAFVPENGHEALSAIEKQGLLERAAFAFEDRPFVESITVIPDSYLRHNQGVTGMQQVARMFDTNIIALVSYDQLTVSHERESAILYWTIVGALVVKGNSNQVQTMVDTAVFDVETGSLLFRAPGVAKEDKNTTLVKQSKDLRALRVKGFSDATVDMTKNLDAELTEFKAAVKKGKGAKTQWSDGGGGALGFLSIVLIFGLLIRARCLLATQRLPGN